MTLVYAESSAVLSWLLGEPTQDDVVQALENADDVVTSAITPIECARGLVQARIGKRITAGQEAVLLRLLDEAVLSWNVVEVTDAVTTIARQEFPREPVRTLNAIHLASALIVREAVGALTMLSFDHRVRENAAALEMGLAPKAAPR